MENELFINNVKLDLDKGIVIPLNFAISDVKEPEKRQRNFTKKINLPGTRKNNKFFSSAWDLHLSDVRGDGVGFDFDPTLRYPAKINKGGVTIFKGAANLQKVIQKDGVNSFEIVLYSETVNLFQSLGDIKLAELGWSEYDHILSIANIQASWSAPVGSGYLYPLIDFGFTSDPTVYKTNELRPYVYVPEIVSKALSVVNWTYDSNFLDSARIQKLIYGYGGGERIDLDAIEIANRRVNYTADGTQEELLVYSNIDVLQQVVNWDYTFNYPVYDSAFMTTSLVSDTYAQYNNTTGEVVVYNAGTYRSEFTGTFPINYQFTGPLDPVFAAQLNLTFTVRVYKNFAVIKEEVVTIADTLSFGTPSGSDTASFNFSVDSQFLPSDVISFELVMSTNGTVTNLFGITAGITLDIDIDLDNTLEFDITALNEGLVDGDTVNIARYLPDIKAADFLQDLITMFNLYMSDPDEDGVVKIEPIDTYYFGTDDTDNWTEKLDRGRTIEIEPAANIEGKVYEFHWAHDEDYYKGLYAQVYGTQYGDYDYNVPSTFKKGVKKYHLKTAQSVPVQIEGTNLIIPRIIKVDESTQVTSPYKGKPRMFFYNGLISSSTWVLRESDTLIGFNQTQYPQAHHLDNVTSPTFDLNFGVPQWVYYTASSYTTDNLFSEYQAQFIRELTARDSKIVNAYFKLDESDLYPDFLRRLVNIDGVIYRKNLVKDFRANNESTTKVELVKILTGNSRVGFTTSPPPGGFEPPIDGIGDIIDSGPIDTDTETKSYQTLYEIDASGGDVTISLGEDVRPGKSVEIKRVDNTDANSVFIDPQSAITGKTLDGNSTPFELFPQECLTVMNDGTNFKIV